MAKIKQDGDSERVRWRHPKTREELVLTTHGRLLLMHRKPSGGSAYTYVFTRTHRLDIERAEAYAAAHGMQLLRGG